MKGNLGRDQIFLKRKSGGSDSSEIRWRTRVSEEAVMIWIFYCSLHEYEIIVLVKL